MDAQADSGGPSRPDLPLPVRSLPHDLCHGWDLPWWLPAPRHVGSSQTRDQTWVSGIGRQILNHWTTPGASVPGAGRPTVWPGAEETQETRAADRPAGPAAELPPPVTGSQSRKGAIAAPERHYL